MVNSGTGHDRCPSVFPGPIRRPGATLRWRLRNYKSRFWFQEGVKIFCPDLDRPAGALRQRGQRRLEGAPLRRELGPGARRGPACVSALPTGVLGLRALFHAARSAAMAWSKKPSEV